MRSSHIYEKNQVIPRYLFIMLYYDYNPNNRKVDIETIAEHNINLIEKTIDGDYSIVGIFNKPTWKRMINIDKRMIKIVNSDDVLKNDARNIALALQTSNANNVFIMSGMECLDKRMIDVRSEPYVVRMEHNKNHQNGLVRNRTVLEMIVPSSNKDWSGFAYYSGKATDVLRKVCLDEDKHNLMQSEIINQAITEGVTFKVK